MPTRRSRLLALAACLASCQAPDRWHVSGSQGYGTIEGDKELDFDTSETSVEVGVSGALGLRPEPERRPVPSLEPISSPGPSQEASGGDDFLGLDLETLMLLLAGAGAWKGSEVGYRTYRKSKAA